MSLDLCAQQETLRQMTRTDPDPRGRRRAHALFVVADGHSMAAVARLFGTAPHGVRAWRARFVAGGRQGLADEPRTGECRAMGGVRRRWPVTRADSGAVGRA